MDTFLQIVGALTLIALSLGVCVLLFLRFKLRQVADVVTAVSGEETARRASTSTHGPTTIHVLAQKGDDWRGEGGAASYHKELLELGYTDGGLFKIKEMSEFAMAVYAASDETHYAVLYKNEQLGHWIDLAAETEDGFDITVSNAPHGGELDHRENAIKRICPTDGLDALLKTFADCQNGKILKVSGLNKFAKVFEASYKRDQIWRLERGGMSTEEIRRLAEAQNDSLSEELIAQVQEEQNEQLLYRLEQDVLEQFQDETILSVAEWKQHEDNMFIVTEHLSVDLGREYILEQVASLEDSDVYSQGFAEKYQSALAGCKSLQDCLNFLQENGIELKKLGSVAEPVVADIYVILS